MARQPPGGWLPGIDSEISPRRNRAYSPTARFMECVAFRTHPFQTQVSSVEQPWGRGAPGKTPFVAAVETTPEGKPVQLKLRRVASFCNHAISIFAGCSLDPACEVVSDGLACFGAVAKAGCAHQVVKTGSGAAAARTPGFQWVNTALGNIKSAIVGTYRAIDQKHVPR